MGDPTTEAATPRGLKALAPVVAAVALAAHGAAGAGAAGPQVAVGARAPATIPFGDPFTYVVEATVPAAAADTARLTAGVGPFAVLAAEPLERATSGETARLRLVRRLACLGEDCLGKQRTLRVALPAPVVESEGRSVRGAPAVVAVEGRVEPGSVRLSPDMARADARVPPASGTGPGTVEAFLAGVAAAAFLAAIALAALALRRGGRVATDPLGRAIRLVRESAGRPAPDRRRAADLLARVAGDRDRGPLAAEATHVAWAPSQPTPAAVEELAAHALGETA